MALKTALTRCLKPPSPAPILPPLARTFSINSSNKPKNPKLVNFSLPSDSDSEPEPTTQTRKPDPLPPPYNPFAKTHLDPQPDDPSNLQEVFHNLRQDGLMSSAAKMLDGLSQQGLTHEALELFSEIKDNGKIPDVVAHTAVMEAYVDAGRAREAWKVYQRMLASGVLPNAYTYQVVIGGLVRSGDAGMVKEARKCVLEMVGRGIRPSARVCVGVYEGLVGVGLEGEGRGVLEMVREKGVAPEESEVREALRGKGGDVHRSVMSALYGK